MYICDATSSGSTGVYSSSNVYPDIMAFTPYSGEKFNWVRVVRI